MKLTNIALIVIIVCSPKQASASILNPYLDPENFLEGYFIDGQQGDYNYRKTFPDRKYKSKRVYYPKPHDNCGKCPHALLRNALKKQYEKAENKDMYLAKLLDMGFLAKIVTYPTYKNEEMVCNAQELPIQLTKEVTQARNAHTQNQYFNILYQRGYLKLVVDYQAQIETDAITAQKIKPNREDIDVLMS